MNSAALPMSPQLSTRCALAMLGAMALASAFGLLALDPAGAATEAHRLADARPGFGLRNGWSAVLQAPLLLAALAGLQAVRRGMGACGMRRAWAAFFALVALATVAGVADHLAPSTACYALSRLPAASACALLAAIFLAERVGPVWVGPLALRLALASGPIAGVAWLASELLHGVPDYRLLIWLEHLPVLLVPLGAWSLPSRGLRGGQWIIALLWFAAAALIDWADLAVWDATGGAIGGHALHHLALAACIGWLAWCAARQPAARRGSAAPPGSQRQTSLITSG